MKVGDVLYVIDEEYVYWGEKSFLDGLKEHDDNVAIVEAVVTRLGHSQMGANWDAKNDD